MSSWMGVHKHIPRETFRRDPQWMPQPSQLTLSPANPRRKLISADCICHLTLPGTNQSSWPKGDGWNFDWLVESLIESRVRTEDYNVWTTEDVTQNSQSFSCSILPSLLNKIQRHLNPATLTQSGQASISAQAEEWSQGFVLNPG